MVVYLLSTKVYPSNAMINHLLIKHVKLKYLHLSLVCMIFQYMSCGIIYNIFYVITSNQLKKRLPSFFCYLQQFLIWEGVRIHDTYVTEDSMRTDFSLQLTRCNTQYIRFSRANYTKQYIVRTDFPVQITQYDTLYTRNYRYSQGVPYEVPYE